MSHSAVLMDSSVNATGRPDRFRGTIGGSAAELGIAMRDHDQVPRLEGPSDFGHDLFVEPSWFSHMWVGAAGPSGLRRTLAYLPSVSLTALADLTLDAVAAL